MIEDLVQYLEENKIVFIKHSDNVVEINKETYELVYPDEEDKIFDKNFELICETTNEYNYVFEFGGKWYYTPSGTEDNVQLNELKYLGHTEMKGIPFLGIHGKYEILNGSRNYDDWCKKAKFKNIDTLGICEKNTLAGVFQFQKACLKHEIKPILGASYTIYREKEDYRYVIKCYVKNETGWLSLLRLNKLANVDNHKFIPEIDFLKHKEGLFIIIDPKSLDFDKMFPLDLQMIPVYFQLDSVEYTDNTYDTWYLNNVQKFLDFARKKTNMSPIFIQDAYYLDQEDSYIKLTLNKISGVTSEHDSNNQYMKSFDEAINEFLLVTDSKDDFKKVLSTSITNLNNLVDKCNFQIAVGNKYLPRYRLSEEEQEKFKDNEELFWHLIKDGLKRKAPRDQLKLYVDRVKHEYKTIKKGDVIDYFLILWDIVSWCRSQDILIGVGRGSAAGSLVAYLLDLVEINPIKFNLLFERFLNDGRVGNSLPDIDLDLPSSRREDVKHYMERRYGKAQVCSVGTYMTFQMKAAMKDLAKLKSLSVGEMNYLTKILDLDEGDLADLFKNSVKNVRLKKFVQENVDIINSINLILGQPKAESTHASAVLIAPIEKEIFDWIPVKMGSKDGTEMLVSEWEGDDLDECGFLKEDILGIAQLDKFTDILQSVKKVENQDINIYTLPLDDQKVLKYFQNGWNGDIFHFGSPGLTGYCRSLKPAGIEELFATISLYRPGAMESGSHNEYILLKEGKREPEYDFGLEEVTKNTFGLYIYQEQIMKACQVLADFTLVEADDIRKALGKKKKEIIEKYGDQFISKAIENGCPEPEAKEIWKKLERFAKYGFNRSHSASYAITGYIGQWLKVYYPVHFWTTAFKFDDKQKHTALFISEINKTGSIKLLPPDINISRGDFYTDFKKNTLFWSLTSIKQCADKSIEQLDQDKLENGEYFDFDEFLTRNQFKGSKINKRVIENLILCGAFDKIEQISDPRIRKRLLVRFYESIGHDVKKDEKCLLNTEFSIITKSWWWTLQQRTLCGLGFFEYKSILELNKFSNPVVGDLFFNKSVLEQNSVSVGGYILDIDVRTTKKKDEYARLTLDSNYDIYPVTIWANEWEKFKDQIEGSEKSILLISGVIVSYKGNHSLTTNNGTKIKMLK